MRSNTRLRFLAATPVLLGLALFTPALAYAGLSHYEVRVDGLACPFCAYGLEKNLKALPGAHDVDIDLDRGLAIFDVGGDEIVHPQMVQEAIRKAGFTPREITVRAEGTLSGDAEHPTLDVGGGLRLRLDGGAAYETLLALLRSGEKAVSITGRIRSAEDGWVLEVAEVRATKAS